MAESLAWKAAKIHVFSTELGCGTLQIWKDILKHPPPLSPPIFTQISSSGHMPSCHVNLLFLEIKKKYYVGTGSYLQKGITNCILLPLILVWKLEHFLTKVWHIAQSSQVHLLSTSLQGKRERESHHSLCNSSHLPFTSDCHS